MNAIYQVWSRYFRRDHELFVSYTRPYFISHGVLRQTAGLLQIRDYATETNDVALLAAFRSLRGDLKEAKQQFHRRLIMSNSIDYFGEPASAHIRPTKQSRQPTAFAQVLDRRLALAGTIVHELKSDSHLGRTKLAKLFYLADASQDLKLQTEYYREAAGPLDPRALYNDKIGIESVAAARGYFFAKGNGRAVKYAEAEHLHTFLQQAPKIFGGKWSGVKRLIAVCRNLTTDQSEIIATLFACWNDLLLDGKRVSDQLIVREFRTNWHQKKRRFTEERLIKALGWMRSCELVPEGRGKHTRTKPVEDTGSADF